MQHHCPGAHIRSMLFGSLVGSGAKIWLAPWVCLDFLASGPEYVKVWKRATGQRLMKSRQEVILEVNEVQQMCRHETLALTADKLVYTFYSKLLSAFYLL